MGIFGSNEAVTFPLPFTCCLLLSSARPSRIPRRHDLELSRSAWGGAGSHGFDAHAYCARASRGDGGKGQARPRCARRLHLAGHSTGAGRAAETIAYGYDSFPKTLSQWIDSAGHRRNLLLHGASRVGVASVKSATTGRTYWAMEIAGDYERPKLTTGTKQAAVAKPKTRTRETCRLKILSICL